MRFSKRSLEGELTIDNRLSGGALFESATITCCHCQRIVVLNPNRTRPRNHCRKCDKYECDECAAVGECRPFKRIQDERKVPDGLLVGGG